MVDLLGVISGQRCCCSLCKRRTLSQAESCNYELKLNWRMEFQLKLTKVKLKSVEAKLRAEIESFLGEELDAQQKLQIFDVLVLEEIMKS